MDQSFNDQELSDIMKEIEALEEDFDAPLEKSSSVIEELASLEEDHSVPLSTSSVSTEAVVDDGPADESTEERIEAESFQDEPVAEVKPKKESIEMEHIVQEPKAHVMPFESRKVTEAPKTHHGTTMSFKVQGDITLDLSFDIGNKVISLHVTESGLSIEMEGGMKFTVPVGEKSDLKKAV
jgi:hypothetical protein